MLSSVLLHFADAQHGQPIIDLGVRLARRSAARVRGLSLVDTRRLAELTSTSEAACYAATEFDRLHRVEAEQDTVRQQLSQACLSAGLDFDLRRVRGNPLEVLPPESQFHDLVVTSFPCPGESESAPGALSAADLLDLMFQGVEPLLVVRSAERPLRRVLIVGDGTRPSARAIRHFVQQNLLPGAELRLLAVGPNETQSRAALREMADYCHSRGLVFESGCLCGTPRKAIVPYAEKWSADLIVLGIKRSGRVMRRLLGDAAETILRSTELALYAAT